MLCYVMLRYVNSCCQVLLVMFWADVYFWSSFFNILENGNIEIVLFMWYVSGYFINPL